MGGWPPLCTTHVARPQSVFSHTAHSHQGPLRGRETMRSCCNRHTHATTATACTVHTLWGATRKREKHARVAAAAFRDTERHAHSQSSHRQQHGTQQSHLLAPAAVVATSCTAARGTIAAASTPPVAASMSIAPAAAAAARLFVVLLLVLLLLLLLAAAPHAPHLVADGTIPRPACSWAPAAAAAAACS